VLACGDVGCADVIPIGQVVVANRNRACIRASPITRVGLVVGSRRGAGGGPCLCLSARVPPAFALR
jgi:hypothetical protein